jgi:hypothetical protein
MSRAIRLGLFAAVVATAAPIVVFSVALALAPEPTDFMCFWSGAALVVRGQDPYDPATWSAAVDGLFSNWLGLQRRPPCPGSYAYPLWTAIATAPLGVLPLRVAALVWMLLLVGGLAAGILLLARSARLAPRRTLLFAAITLGSQPAWLTALTSQFGGIDLAALGLLALPATAARPGRFSLGVMLLLLKPHIAPLVVLERARAAAPRALATAGAVALGLAVVSLVVRPSWPAEWLDELLGHRTATAGALPTLYGFTVWLTGQVTTGLIVVGLALAGFFIALRGAYVSDALDRVAVAVTAGLLAVPYLSSGDPIVLAVAWCAILRRAGARPIAVVVALVVAADVLPWVLYAMREPVAPPGDFRNALELPATAALLAIVLRRPPNATPSA